ncbi:DUF4267 domain-containing protein [Pseudonocardia acaciae]|uniref:DUF4267 domain-containing protein n=1 Tax=Pseudonocardia acaciae TaxID=551276 RepID=UPI000688F7B1|nr:DUF4267 domain-containing protein [Pseudonocardia acaciae]
MRKFGYAVAVVAGVGIIWIGARYLVDPGAIAGSFGVPNPPPADDPFLRVKGVRDIGSGLIALTLVATGQRRALGWGMLATSVIPAGDAIVVLTNGGSPAVALGVHGLTAAALVAGAIGLLRTGTAERVEVSRRPACPTSG